MILMVRQVVTLVRLPKTSGKTGGETGPPLANSPTLHSTVIRKDPTSRSWGLCQDVTIHVCFDSCPSPLKRLHDFIIN